MNKSGVMVSFCDTFVRARWLHFVHYMFRQAKKFFFFFWKKKKKKKKKKLSRQPQVTNKSRESLERLIERD